MSHSNEVIILVDMDCFYVQVEQRLQPEFRGKPCAVVQYKTYKGGSIVAVGYEARSVGVKRGMLGDEAKAICNEIQLFKIPEKRGKGDLTRYREACAEIIKSLSKFTHNLEKASVDEAYLNIKELVTERKSKYDLRNLEELQKLLGMTHIATYKQSNKWLETLNFDEDLSRIDLDLILGASIATEIRQTIFNDTGFTCSIGISRNKMLSKLACTLMKPNGQTILPSSCVEFLFRDTPIRKIRNLGGKFGSHVEEMLGVEMMHDVYKFGKKKLIKLFGEKEGSYLFQLSEGTYFEPLRKRQISKSLGCGKNFMGPETLRTPQKIQYWLRQFALELLERIETDFSENNRMPQSISLHFRPIETSKGISRVTNFALTTDDRISEQMWHLMIKERIPQHLLIKTPIPSEISHESSALYNLLGITGINSLSMGVSKFVPKLDLNKQGTLNFTSFKFNSNTSITTCENNNNTNNTNTTTTATTITTSNNNNNNNNDKDCSTSKGEKMIIDDVIQNVPTHSSSGLLNENIEFANYSNNDSNHCELLIDNTSTILDSSYINSNLTNFAKIESSLTNNYANISPISMVSNSNNKFHNTSFTGLIPKNPNEYSVIVAGYEEDKKINHQIIKSTENSRILLDNENPKNLLHDKNSRKRLDNENPQNLLEDENSRNLLLDENSGSLLNENSRNILEDENSGSLLNENPQNLLLDENSRNILHTENSGSLLNDENPQNLLLNENIGSLLNDENPQNLLLGDNSRNILHNENSGSLLDDENSVQEMITASLLLECTNIDVATLRTLPIDIQKEVVNDIKRMKKATNNKPTNNFANFHTNLDEMYRIDDDKVTIKCITCGKRVPKFTLQLHKDEHFASAMHDILITSPRSSTSIVTDQTSTATKNRTNSKFSNRKRPSIYGQCKNNKSRKINSTYSRTNNNDNISNSQTNQTSLTTFFSKT